MAYSEQLKARLLQRMLGDGASAYTVAYDSGVPETTVRRWRRAATVSAMGGSGSDGSKPARSPREWAVEEKLRVVAEAAALSEAELGGFLRREGLHSSQLQTWQKLAESALGSESSVKKQKSLEDQRVRHLEREIRRKDKALAEVTALLALSKKVRLLLGDAGDDTASSSED